MRPPVLVCCIAVGVAAGQVIREEGAVLRERCEPHASEVARLDGGTQVKLRLVVAGSDSTCVAVRLERDGQKLDGFVDKDALRDIEKFEEQRREAAATEVPQGAKPLVAKPLTRKAWAPSRQLSARGSSKAAPKSPPARFPSVPDFSFVSANEEGRKITRESLAGKTYLIQFWADWCRACAAQMPDLRRLYTKYREKQFEIVTLAFDQAPADAPWLRSKVEGGFGGEAARKFGVERIPATLLVDAQGRILGRDLSGAQIEHFVGERR